MEFLSQLRLHSDPSLHPLIDEILENLLKLLVPTSSSMDDGHAHQDTPLKSPNVPSDEERNATEVTSTFLSEYTSDMASYSQHHILKSLPRPQHLPSPSDSSPTVTGGEGEGEEVGPVGSGFNMEQLQRALMGRGSSSSSSSSSEAVSWTSLAPEGTGFNLAQRGRLDFPYSASTVIPRAPRGWGSGGGASDSAGDLKSTGSETKLTGQQFLLS